ncbi:MAG: helix-turn-helix transcriptional regulator [Ktedonobacteraceae bacterium]|nr:helix-turn-helix transcriptional regulator [Ktedonobacteraceae bacterium]
MMRLRVKEIAEQKGFNQSSLSRAANLSFNTIKRIYRNPYKEVASTTLERIAKALGVSIADLIEEVPDKEVPDQKASDEEESEE